MLIKRDIHGMNFTCRTAASKGQLVCLQYLHENGCPWDKTTIEYAEMGRPNRGHADCVEYAKKNGCPNPGTPS